MTNGAFRLRLMRSWTQKPNDWRILKVKRILKGEKIENWWKLHLGRRVAALTKISEVPKEVKALIENVKIALKSV